MRRTYLIRYCYRLPRRCVYTTGFYSGTHSDLHHLWGSVFSVGLEIVKYEVVSERFLV